ncbi:hypothetical protein [Congregibacter sp.]|uniref:hypothetical protein n=1 Tax=Congregibacter sp. TaxID=2744308 RepID=UPI0039E5D9A0
MSQNSTLRRLAELAGAISIVLSLVFVGLELRQANNLAEAEGVRSINEMLADLNIARMTDAGLNELIVRASQSDKLDETHGFTAAQRTQLISYFSVWLTYGEASWKYYERGIIDFDQHEDGLSILCFTFSRSPAVIEVWQSFDGYIAEQLVSDVEARCPPLTSIE